LHGASPDAEYLPHFLGGQSGEDPQLSDPDHPFVELSEATESLVECQQLDPAARVLHHDASIECSTKRVYAS
jgi:hypothetical protein